MGCPGDGQVHVGVLSKELVESLGWRWRAKRDVVVKVQHPDMCRLMDSDVRNLGRLSEFVKPWLPFDPIPVRSCPPTLPCSPRPTPLVARLQQYITVLSSSSASSAVVRRQQK